MPGENLAREEAAERAAKIVVDSYLVDLDLTTSPSTFETTCTVVFTCADPGTDTWLDFLGTQVHSVTCNGRPVPVEFDGARVHLRGLQASNAVVVSGTATFTNSGEGLHRFVDPVDNEVYLYTQFQVAEARRVFPVFEQPDVKAAFTFHVTAPAYWRVISNQPTPEPIPLGPRHWAKTTEATVEVARWEFAPTPRMSCYITALIAGPYVGTGGGAVPPSAQREHEVPLGVYCRRSLEPYLDADEIMSITASAFPVFEEQFGQPYPFAKYDQVFTPEYNMGAMENVGAITFTEGYVFRAKVSDFIVERRALTILHELAHMWFGDLVTMRWWDDLWLNESFAEWASTDLQARTTRWTDAWTTFAAAEKAWAYSQDQLSSTHPIKADITTIEDVQINFDGITYAKGASVLKQLVAYVGRDAFIGGVRAYFVRYAWGNTTLPDFLGELEQTSGRDLQAWASEWLETAGVNTLIPVIETDEAGLITSLTVQQSAPESHPTLRSHRLRIGAYDVLGDQLRRRDVVELDISGPQTAVPQFVGLRRPDVLLVNDEDLAYAKIRIDEVTVANLLARPTLRMDSLTRALLLGSLWDQVRDAETSARDHLRLALAWIPEITDSSLLRIALGQVATSVTLYIAPEHRDAAKAYAVRSLRELVGSAAAGSDAQLQLVTAYCGLATDAEDLEFIGRLLDGQEQLDGLAVDTEMRWTMITALAAGGAADDAVIDAALRNDDTATGRERAARSRAARPSPAAKEAAWVGAVEGTELPNQMVAALWQGFTRAEDHTLLEPYVERYHASLEQVWSTRTIALAESVVAGFYPSRLAGPELLATTQQWLDSHPQAAPALRRLVAENRDIVARAVAAQARDAATTDAMTPADPPR